MLIKMEGATQAASPPSPGDPQLNSDLSNPGLTSDLRPLIMPQLGFETPEMFDIGDVVCDTVGEQTSEMPPAPPGGDLLNEGSTPIGSGGVGSGQGEELRVKVETRDQSGAAMPSLVNLPGTLTV